MQEASEVFLKINNNQSDEEIYLTRRQTEILLYSLFNGIFATVAFLVFLYFIFRRGNKRKEKGREEKRWKKKEENEKFLEKHLMKMAAECNDMGEKDIEEGCLNDSPPSYEEVVNGIRY
ncbi:hypothetical protein LOAG_12982 [Loa loa]|uniref:Uncharacterized protein n=1 Tax=Loa loa TaxID=7209 RepID=A0A1S0TKB7_LOALO|nr:hypothetical protein LOAG_12982 [Loa loa]EFO15528.1 hypothetical protein LOAG_12982 [Loa loa]